MLKVHGMVHAPIVVLPAPQEGVFTVGDVSNDQVQEILARCCFHPSIPS